MGDYPLSQPTTGETKMNVARLDGKTCLVTGAGSGIGQATAIELARRGAKLVLCDLNEQGLAATAKQLHALGKTASVHRVDVSNRQQMRDFAAAVHRQVPAVDLLMNNAGVGLGADFLDTELEDWDWIIDVNLKGVVHGCHFFLPEMVRRGIGGHVINVASSGGLAAADWIAAYCTTKFAVVGLSEALRLELSRHRIGVTTVCPGFINTAIAGTSRARGRQATPRAMARSVEMLQKRAYSPERAARAILSAVGRNRALAPVAPEAWAIYAMKRLAPDLLGWIGRRLSDRMRTELAESRPQGSPTAMPRQ